MPFSSQGLDSQYTYIFDTENTVELARLIHQDQQVARTMGGLLPEQSDLEGLHDVLDVACGPGGWALELAAAQPHLRITGIDISQNMIEYARSLVTTQQLGNARFEVMNALEPLAFPDHAFDLVNARFLAAFVPPSSWPLLLRELLRVCRPGGLLRLTEKELPLTSSPTTERLMDLFLTALRRRGRTIFPSNRTLGVTPLLERLMEEAGCVGVQNRAYAQNLSAGSPEHAGWVQNTLMALTMSEPLLIEAGVVTRRDFQQLSEQLQRELQDERFRCIQFLLTAWGRKPGGLHSPTRN